MCIDPTFGCRKPSFVPPVFLLRLYGSAWSSVSPFKWLLVCPCLVRGQRLVMLLADSGPHCGLWEPRFCCQSPGTLWSRWLWVELSCLDYHVSASPWLCSFPVGWALCPLPQVSQGACQQTLPRRRGQALSGIHPLTCFHRICSFSPSSQPGKTFLV